MFCGNCGTRIESSLNRCSNCGWVLSTSDKLRCSVCGNIVKEGDVFCGTCGNKVVTEGIAMEFGSTEILLLKIILGYKNKYDQLQNATLFKKMELKSFNKIVGISADECLEKMNNIYRMIVEHNFNVTTDFPIEIRNMIHKLKSYYEKGIPIMMINDPKFQRTQSYPIVMQLVSLIRDLIRDIDEILLKY